MHLHVIKLLSQQTIDWSCVLKLAHHRQVNRSPLPFAMATLDQYDFRKIRKSPPPKKVKQEAKPTVAPQPVVQKADDDDLKLLKDFDLNYDYGPNIVFHSSNHPNYVNYAPGLTRLERWERAKLLGLNPDPLVKTIIGKHSGDPRYTEGLWADTLLGIGTDSN